MYFSICLKASPLISKRVETELITWIDADMEREKEKGNPNGG